MAPQNTYPTNTLGSSSYSDGSSNAPAGTPQLPGLLNGYLDTPPWEVAGVNYAVGVPADVGLQDPATMNIPGVSVNAADHTITVTGNGVTIQGYNFSLEGGLWQIVVESANVTLEDNNFDVGSNFNSLTGVIFGTSSSSNLTVSYNTIDGGANPNSLIQPWTLLTVYAALIVMDGVGATVEYNWLKNSADQNFDIQGGGPVLYAYNLIENSALVEGVHNNFIQFSGNSGGVTYSSPQIIYNTAVQNALGGNADTGAGEGLQVEAQLNTTITNALVSNNVVIASPQTGGSIADALSYEIALHQLPGSNLNTGAIVQDNYLDPRGAFGALYPDNGADPASNVTNVSNINMVTGSMLPNSASPPVPTGTSADLITNDAATGDYEIYDIGQNRILAAYPLAEISRPWQIAGLGGFNSTDTSDALLRNTSNGAFELFDISNNDVNYATSVGQVGLEWAVSGFGDFSGNPGETDMVMRDSSTGQFEIYDISNNEITSAAPMGQVGLEWTVAGFGDFGTRPNETDMLMRNSNTGQFELYDISNNQLTSAAGMGQVGLEWKVAGFGDFSGNANETDMVMRNSNTEQFEIFDIRNNAITNAAYMGQVGLEWQVVGFGPIDGVGASDMLMRDSNNGAFEIYDIANNQLTNAAAMGQVGLEWSVAGIAADPPIGSSSAAQFAQVMASYAPNDGAVVNSPASYQPGTQSIAPNVLATTNGQSPLPS